MTAFPGFPTDLQPFLEDLEDHNDRDWFQAHRARYEHALLEPAKAFVAALVAPLAAFEPPVTAEPRVNGSIFRIARDTRFSADKTPYKTHVAFQFWLGSDKKRNAAFYLSIGPDGCAVGAGLFGTHKDDLERLRAALAGAEGAAFATTLDGLVSEGWEISGEKLARVPRGYAKDHPRAELLKHKGLYVHRSRDLGSTLHTPRVVDEVVSTFRAVAPVSTWLQRHAIDG